MDKQQRKNLIAVQTMLRKLNRRERNSFDMDSLDECAYGLIRAKGILGLAPGWGMHREFLEKNVGLSEQESQFLFQNDGGTDIRLYDDLRKKHPGCLYDNVRGDAAVVECIDRIENVLQFHA